MPRFLILFKSTAKARDLMANSSPEDIKASMDEWIQWKDDLDAAIGFEWGMPLQAVGEVMANSIGESTSTVSGYAIMEGDKEAVLEVLKTHPQQKRADASIDVMEMLPMEGTQ